MAPEAAIEPERRDTDESVIRRFRLTDADAVSAVICNTLLISNSPDYDIEVVRNLSRGFTPRALRSMSHRRLIWVYEEDGRITATVALEDDTVSGFFVVPDRQGCGIGTRLLRFLEDKARQKGLRALRLSASLTAVGFYEKLGYRRTGESGGDDLYGRVVRMRKTL